MENIENITYLFEQVNNLATLANGLQSMLQSSQGAQPQHLKNCTDDARLALSEKGVQTMAKVRRRVCIGYEEDGKSIPMWIRAKSEEEWLEKAVDAILQSARRHEVLKRNGITTEVQTPQRKIPTVCELAKMYIDSVATTSKSPYTSHLKKHILPLLGDKKIDEVSATDVSQMFAAKENLSKSTLTGIHAVLNGIFRIAIEEDYIHKNPVESTLVKVKGQPAKKREALTEDQEGEILSLVQKLPEQSRLFMLLLMFTGARKGEIIGLRRKDVTRENVHIEQAVKHASVPEIGGTKNKIIRDINMRDMPDDSWWGIIEPIIKDLRPDDLLFCHKGDRSKPFTQHDYLKMRKEQLSPIFERYNVTAHNFRHTKATRLVERCDGDLTTVADIMGDRVETVMGVYNHTSPEKKGKLMGKVNAALLNSGTQNYTTSA